jgi:hypothetical protein
MLNCVKMVQFNLIITKRRALMLILAAISVMVIDSTIVKFIALSNKEYPTLNVSIFVTLTIVFIVIVIILLAFVKSKSSETGLRRGLSVKSNYVIVVLTQLSLISIMLIIIHPIINLNSYNILSLFAVIYISHTTALFFLMSLVVTLVDWIMTKRNKILSLYAISFALTGITIITSLLYATYVLSYHTSNIKPSSIHQSLLTLPEPQLAINFGPALDITSILSFVSVWVASAILLSTYGRRMGRMKYWTIISIPLIYFLFPFERNLIDIFQPFIISSPVLYGILNVTIFSATKQIGALFFSLAFLVASTLVTKYEMRKYMLITGIGMAILFGSIEIDSLLYATYPPFGLITVSFIPMGSYLVLTGITLSAILLARDKGLRGEFYRSAMSQLSLLKTIGVTEMENQLIKSYKSMEKQTRSLDTKESRFEKDKVREILHGLVDDLDRDDVREILHDVLDDVYSKSKSNTDIEGKDDFH